MKLPAKTARSLRKVFFFLHLWFGVVLGVWFVAVGLSGSILAWLPQLLTYEMTTRFHDSPKPGQSQITVTQAVEAFRAAYPNAPEPGYVVTPNFRFPVYMVVQRKLGSVPVDPYSGQVRQPFNKPDMIVGKISTFHGNLLLGAKGLVFNGVASVLGLVLLLTGVWLWWPSNWRQLKIRLSVKRKAPFRRLVMDLHNVTGMYLFAILFVTTLTSAMLVFDHQVEAALGGVPKAAPVKVVPPRGAKALGDNELTEIARRTVPDQQLMGVERVLKSGTPFEAHFGSQTGLAVGAQLLLDPYTGKVLRLERNSSAVTAKKVMSLATDLHYGFFGGFTTQLLYTAAGLMPLFLFVTGLLMWWKRKQAEWSALKRKEARGQTAA